MPENKEQKITVVLSFSPSDKQLILNGIKLASLFKKELCLLYNYSKKEKKNIPKIKSRLQEYTLPVKTEIPGLKVSTVLVSDSSCFFAAKLSDDIEAILILVEKSNYSKYSKAVTESPIPFLFIDCNNNAAPNYNKLVLQIDFRKEFTDSAIWSSYFGRFNGAKISIVAANDKQKDVQRQVGKNVSLTKKLFLKFKIEHKVYKGSKSSLRNAFEALDFAESSQSNILVLLGSSTITPLDYLIGLPEKKIIKRSNNVSILIVNPRRDNYVLCD